MKLFWARGYEAASLPMLLEAMGIARSSFYASFADKRTVFLECLELFARRTLHILDDEEIECAPERAAAVFFERTLFEVPRRRCAYGCMMVNTILELAEVDAQLSQIAAQKLDLIEQRFQTLFLQAQAQGRLDASHSSVVLARYVMNVNQGLRVSSRKGLPAKQLRETVEVSLAMAGLAPLAA